jgi:hypothetical protein
MFNNWHYNLLILIFIDESWDAKHQHIDNTELCMFYCLQFRTQSFDWGRHYVFFNYSLIRFLFNFPSWAVSFFFKSPTTISTKLLTQIHIDFRSLNLIVRPYTWKPVFNMTHFIKIVLSYVAELFSREFRFIESFRETHCASATKRQA